MGPHILEQLSRQPQMKQDAFSGSSLLSVEGASSDASNPLRERAHVTPSR